MIIMVEHRSNTNKVTQYVNKIKDMLCDIEDCMEEETYSRSRNTSEYDSSEYTPRRRNVSHRYDW